jgi:hypothetical protein
MVQFQEAQKEDLGNGQPDPEPNIYDLLDAPNFTALLKPASTRKAKEYTAKTNSMLKAGLIGCLNAGDFPDAAAILKHGPGFAQATGQLADSSDKAAAFIDMMTAPASPLVVFLMTAIPLASQIVRNHESQVAQIPEVRRQRKAMAKAAKQARTEREPRFKIRAFRREWPIYWNVKAPRWSKFLAGFKSQTQEPMVLAYQVFQDPDVIAALKKMGVNITRPDNEAEG